MLTNEVANYFSVSEIHVSMLLVLSMLLLFSSSQSQAWRPWACDCDCDLWLCEGKSAQFSDRHGLVNASAGAGAVENCSTGHPQ